MKRIKRVMTWALLLSIFLFFIFGADLIYSQPSSGVKLPSVTISIGDSDSQVPFSAPPFYLDPDYPMDSYVNLVVLWGTKELDCPQEGLMTRS